ncbi:MAG TPA: 16S rRNA (cytosine(1402)-N(4))-methyltransferase RsmH [Chitinivibrionales bacterium]
MDEALLIDDEESFSPPQPVDSPMPQTSGAGYHAPVLLEECMQALALKPHGTYLDCTVGGGGHFQAIIDRLDSTGTAVGIDRDPEALAWCDTHLRRQAATVALRQRRFSRFFEVLDELGIDGIDGMLLDLGMSSHQISAGHRGFSYMRDTPLDMRMNPSDSQSASDILAGTPASDLARIFSEYGEVHHPLRMAETIVRYRVRHPLRTSEDLKECLRQEYGPSLNIKMLAKLFQSLRIAVNDELSELRRCLEAGAGLLKQGGRLAVISYHSLEDRIVKNFMRDEERSCSCPPAAPICVCGKKPMLKRITRKVIVPTSVELGANPASRSARLRVAEKITPFIIKPQTEGQVHAKPKQ